MCKALPGARCLSHADERYYRLVNTGNASGSGRNSADVIQRDYDQLVIHGIQKSRTNVRHFAENPDAFKTLNPKQRAEYDRDLRLLNRFVEMRQEYTPSDLTDLRREAAARANVARYMDSPDGGPTKFNLPQSNPEIKDMFELLRDSPKVGRALTAEEQATYDEAESFLILGQEDTPHEKRTTLKQSSLNRKPQATPTTPAPTAQGSLTSLQRLQTPEVQAAREAKRNALLRSGVLDLTLTKPKTTHPTITVPKGVNPHGLERPKRSAPAPTPRGSLTSNREASEPRAGEVEPRGMWSRFRSRFVKAA